MSQYSLSSCRPPSGRTYLTIGQDLFSISEYLDGQYNASLHNISTRNRNFFAPAAVMVYTDIQTLRGLDQPADYGSGVEYADGLLDSVFSSSQQVGLQIGLWLNGTRGCRDVVNGRLDDKIQRLFYYLHHCKAPRVFLRVGYEFDNPSFRYSDADLYRSAFRKFHDTCGAFVDWNCLDKVKFVWHSWGAHGTSAVLLEEYYPGDDIVDWIGVSIFQQVFHKKSIKHLERVLDFATQHDKPTMIAESTPFGGITTWDDWFEPVLELIETYDIGMWSYINCNWEAQNMWHGVGFGETRLSTNVKVMHKWNIHVIQNDRFLGAGSLERCGDGTTTRMASVHPSSLPLIFKKFHPVGVVALVVVLVLGIVLAWRRISTRTLRDNDGDSDLVAHSTKPSYGAMEDGSPSRTV